LAGTKEDAAMETTLGLFLVPRGQPHPRFSTMTLASRSTTLVSAMEIMRWIAEQVRRNPKQFGEEDNAAVKINSGKLGFYMMSEGPVFISHF
jgi:hypothetical protein